ncbi:ribonuclease H-like domain-containing protein [Tanacetum coccineum]
MSVRNYVHNFEHGDDYIEDPDPVTLISKLDISDPLHLHPNDSTTLTVVSIKLKGTENYQVWSCDMLLAIERKNKTGFIDGSCKRSNTDEVLCRQWDMVNAVVLGWILNSISEELFLGQNFKKKAKYVWEELKETYDKVDGSILSREVLPDVISAYATISSEESHRVASGSIVGSSQRNQASAFVSNVSNINNLQRNNHNLNNGPRPNNLNNNRQGGGSGLKPGQNFKGKNVSNNNSVETSSSSRFTDEQMATLISLIKDNKIGKNVHANMAGANQHMTYTDKELDNVLDISHLKIKVGHPNGTEAFISKIGNLKLSNGLMLYDVLDLNLKNVLRTDSECEGLYYYNNQVAMG